MYVALMQILEYFMWSDLDNKKGYNKIATSLGPFFNYTQPTILFLVKSLVFKIHNLIVSVINLIYYIYILFRQNAFLNSEKIITTVVNNHLYWRWEKYYNFYIYAITLILNIFIFMNIKYAIMVSIFIFGTLSITSIYFKEHVGEFWCFFVAYIPILVCICTYML
jgi:hypothetical protein